MNRKILLYGGFFVALLIIFFVALFAGNSFWKKQLPVLNEVKPFSFTDQDGKMITDKDVEGKVQAVEFFFTTCKGICPKMNTNMKKVYDDFKGTDNFVILSHTVNPETDSVARMKVYADSLGVDSKTWLFLTGLKTDLYEAARRSYLLDDQKTNPGNIAEDFIHTQLFALVDKQGRVRGIYDGLKKEEVGQMEKDIKLLLND